MIPRMSRLTRSSAGLSMIESCEVTIMAYPRLIPPCRLYTCMSLHFISLRRPRARLDTVITALSLPTKCTTWSLSSSLAWLSSQSSLAPTNKWLRSLQSTTWSTKKRKISLPTCKESTKSGKRNNWVTKFMTKQWTTSASRTYTALLTQFRSRTISTHTSHLNSRTNWSSSS